MDEPDKLLGREPRTIEPSVEQFDRGELIDVIPHILEATTVVKKQVAVAVAV